MRILAIDPGNEESGWAVIDAETRRPLRKAKTGNPELLAMIRAGEYDDCARVGIEMISSYGMAVGQEVFDTCVWVGRFHEANPPPLVNVELVYRRDVKEHHCHTSKATDANVTQALVDRFARGRANFGKGTKAEPGWFHGFAKDIWQAYALAVLIADRAEGYEP